MSICCGEISNDALLMGSLLLKLWWGLQGNFRPEGLPVNNFQSAISIQKIDLNSFCVKGFQKEILLEEFKILNRSH